MAQAAERVQDHEQWAQALGNSAVVYQESGNYYQMKTYLDRMLISAGRVRNTAQQAFGLMH